MLFFFFRGTVDDTELVEGLVLEQKISHLAGGISQVEKAKIGLIQFCISPPKTDVSPCFCKNLLTSLLLLNCYFWFVPSFCWEKRLVVLWTSCYQTSFIYLNSLKKVSENSFSVLSWTLFFVKSLVVELNLKTLMLVVMVRWFFIPTFESVDKILWFYFSSVTLGRTFA